MTAELPAVLDADALGAVSEFARGGAGSIHDVGGQLADERLVLKRFHAGTRVDAGALRAMVDWRLALSAADRSRLDRLATWPLALVEANGSLVGFLMRRVPPDYAETLRLPSGGRGTALREAQYLLAPPRQLARLGIEPVAADTRIEVVWSLAEAVAFLHSHRIVIGDVSSRNVLWAADPGRTLLVDCDAFTIGGVGSPIPPMATVDWDDPAQPGLPAASSDVYKLALFATRVLGGTFRSRALPADGKAIDPAGRALIAMSLSADPDARPSAHAWERWAAGRRAAVRAVPA